MRYNVGDVFTSAALPNYRCRITDIIENNTKYKLEYKIRDGNWREMYGSFTDVNMEGMILMPPEPPEQPQPVREELTFYCVIYSQRPGGLATMTSFRTQEEANSMKQSVQNLGYELRGMKKIKVRV